MVPHSALCEENQAVRRAGVSAYRFVPMPKVFSDQAQTLPTEEAVIKIWQQVPCWPRSGAARSKVPAHVSDTEPSSINLALENPQACRVLVAAGEPW